MENLPKLSQVRLVYRLGTTQILRVEVTVFTLCLVTCTYLSVIDLSHSAWSRIIPHLSHRHWIYFSKIDWVYTVSLRVSGHARGRQLSHWGGGSVACGPGKLIGPCGTEPVSLVPFIQGSESALESVLPVKIPSVSGGIASSLWS